jgi:hypothetical protein
LVNILGANQSRACGYPGTPVCGVALSFCVDNTVYLYDFHSEDLSDFFFIETAMEDIAHLRIRIDNSDSRSSVSGFEYVTSGNLVPFSKYVPDICAFLRLLLSEGDNQRSSDVGDSSVFLWHYHLFLQSRLRK